MNHKKGLAIFLSIACAAILGSVFLLGKSPEHTFTPEVTESVSSNSWEERNSQTDSGHVMSKESADKTLPEDSSAEDRSFPSGNLCPWDSWQYTYLLYYGKRSFLGACSRCQRGTLQYASRKPDRSQGKHDGAENPKLGSAVQSCRLCKLQGNGHIVLSVHENTCCGGYNRKDAAPDIIVKPHFTDYGKLCDGQDRSFPASFLLRSPG